ncbi:aminotransferase [Ancylobacter defluvii]|uniref:Aspartate aminotransferase family protein n=1 Tax=Ancylobacter defluvii TaxID=1282440 RepID=A0A9W6NAK1_9HYPH|nr:aminotransferase [Ancylobacter defluvii]MBS7588850.1 aminotransferase class III-fold pyridoxal phosphate-dependent enzyme [Ancylobacter defluvii]GLK83713.1 aspartate aminotransferase family protein [Ancylobacter defluvii]
MKHFEANSPFARDIAAVLHPHTNVRAHLEKGPEIFTRGKGLFVYDEDGREYFDAAAGLWCASLGFGVERLAQVAYDAMKNLGYYQIFRGASHSAAIELSERLLALTPCPMSKVLLQCSGSEANDTAVKLVWYYWNAVDKPEKRKIISRKGSYHGSTTIDVCLTGKPEFHAGFGLPFPGFLYTDMPYYYRHHVDGESEEQFSQRLADSLEQLILEEGPETIAAFWADPVVGGSGAVLPPKGYFEKVQAILRKYDILFVADEVICGFGRTGNMWGSQTFSLTPDIITCAKALSAAMQPISAVLINDRIFEGMKIQSDRNGRFVHGFTYAGHPVAAAVAIETLKIYDEIDMIGHVKAMEPIFLGGLGALKDHPLVGDVAGCGLIAGVEVVADKKTRAMFPASVGLPAKLEANALKQDLILRHVGNRLAFSPALIITEAEINDLVSRVKALLDLTLAEVS